MRRLVLIVVTVLVVWVTSASATSERRWSPSFRRSEVVQPGHRVWTVVVPVEIRGDVYDCVISEDSTGHRGSADMSIAQTCDLDVPVG